MVDKFRYRFDPQNTVKSKRAKYFEYEIQMAISGNLIGFRLVRIKNNNSNKFLSYENSKRKSNRNY